MQRLKQYRKPIGLAILGLIVVVVAILTGVNQYQLHQTQTKASNLQVKYKMLKKSYDEMAPDDVTYQENITYENMKTIAKTNNEALTEAMQITFGNYPTAETKQQAITKLQKQYLTKTDATALINSVPGPTQLNNVGIYNYSSSEARNGHYYYANVTVTYYGRHRRRLYTNRYLFKVDLNHGDLNSKQVRFHLIQVFKGGKR
ncbi:hypothetical protein M3M35_02735 [Fructilactobacillus myrtifloralis]|uniref:Uncharacterized protein n=1 Tax=Fructilactobacillus myrtifloralis TaxID=2940301 RepID=A0ABY5BQW3_9LACO|nr:hypothetical protein [Fructilactobacillus myrtifloralis]USS85576.1 hypothetical protein M3M35_02735 [Fructilactobacillus myrtifloralis]